MSSQTLTDPRLAHKLSEFISAGEGSDAVSYTKLSYIEKVDNVHYPIKMVLEDYMYEFISSAKTCVMTTEEYLKYKYNPKRLASDVYGSTELYYVILLMNNMCNIRDFDLSTVKLLSKEDMTSFMSKVYSAEKSDIDTYNNSHNV